LQLAYNTFNTLVSMKLETIEPAGDFETRQNRTDVSKTDQMAGSNVSQLVCG